MSTFALLFTCLFIFFSLNIKASWDLGSLWTVTGDVTKGKNPPWLTSPRSTRHGPSPEQGQLLMGQR